MNTRGDDFRYEEMPSGIMIEAVKAFREAIKDFKIFFQNRFTKKGKKDCILETSDEEIQRNTSVSITLDVSDLMLMEIIRRIDQRADYYLYFHSDSMSQTKEVALLAYWVLKYKPLSLWDDLQTNSLFLKKACTVNEYFVVYIIESYLSNDLDIAGEEFRFSEEEYDKMVYNFMHRDMSKEAMICLVGAFLRNIEK